MPAASVAVLVLNWNGQRWLEPCLRALQNQRGLTFESWVLDNGSTDGSPELVRSRFPQARLVAFPRNLGFAGAYNQAIETCQAEFIVLLNNDTVVEPDWLASLVEDLAAQPRAAAVSSKILFLDQPGRLNHAGGRLTTLGAAYDAGFGALDQPAFDRPSITGCASGAAMAMRRAAFKCVGGFDPRYFAYFEDADLCWRFWLHGFTVRYQPKARVLHAYGASTGSGRAGAFRIEQCQVNRLRNMFKNLQTTTLLAALPASFGYDGMRLTDMARKNQWPGVKALLRGTYRFWRAFPAVLAQRKLIQAQRQISDAELVQSGILVGIREAAAEWRRLRSSTPW